MEQYKLMRLIDINVPIENDPTGFIRDQQEYYKLHINSFERLFEKLNLYHEAMEIARHVTTLPNFHWHGRPFVRSSNYNYPFSNGGVSIENKSYKLHDIIIADFLSDTPFIPMVWTKDNTRIAIFELDKLIQRENINVFYRVYAEIAEEGDKRLHNRMIVRGSHIPDNLMHLVEHR